MKILLENILQNYDEEKHIFNNNGEISQKTGEKINFSKEVEYIVPGFIDQHIHGLLGYDTMDNTEESLIQQSKGLLKEGTTSFYPTTMTADLKRLDSVLKTIKDSISKVKGAQILGVHLEGPFINVDKIGAQNPKGIQTLNVDNISSLKNLDIVKMVTYAPELDKNYNFTKFLKENNIIGSVGHSNASAEEVLEAEKNGLMCFTHLHNGCSGYDHRNPGVVTAAYISDKAHKEIIADGIHIEKYTLMSTYKNIGSDKINLVTDAMRAKSMEDGEYDLGGLKVIKKGNEARLKESGSLAGSVLEMNKAVKNMKKLSECTLEEAFKMASYNQSQLFNLKTKGLIKEGYDFDITCLNKELEVVEVYIKGEKVYDKKSN